MRRAALPLVLSLLAACAQAVDEDFAAAIDDPIPAEDAALAFDIVTATDVVKDDRAEPEDLTDVRDAAADEGGATDAAVDDRGGMMGPCGNASNCAGCTALGGCGWCAATSVCVAGTITGPSGGRCEAGWSWSPLACGATADPCAALTACGACLGRSGCGWCGASARCFTANAAATGPATGSCGGMWAGNALACVMSFDPCAATTNCGACANGSTCGWCKDTLSCMSGTATGPSGGRTCGSWAWTRSACRNTSDSCDSSGNCAACNIRSGCGWCDDSNTCHGGGGSGPRDRACAGSQWDSDLLDCL